MILDIKNTNYVIGTKQTKRAIKNNEVMHIIVATDVDDKIVNNLMESCKEAEVHVEIERKYTMEELGKHCGIDVGAAMVAILKSRQGGEIDANN